MALTNAQRQARYRQKLKRAATTQALGEHVRNLVDSTAHIAWKVFTGPAPDGEGWSDADDLPTVEDYRRRLAGEPGRLVATCRDLLWVSHVLEERERIALQALVEIADALALAPHSPPALQGAC